MKKKEDRLIDYELISGDGEVDWLLEGSICIQLYRRLETFLVTLCFHT
jgi:hypothetical protein